MLSQGRYDAEPGLAAAERFHNCMLNAHDVVGMVADLIEQLSGRDVETQGATGSPSPTIPEPMSRELLVAFGSRFKAARLKRGLHRSDLVDRMGLTASRLSLIEDGRLTITLATMTELARRVGLETAALLDPDKLGPKGR